jgi:transposase-like protein
MSHNQNGKGRNEVVEIEVIPRAERRHYTTSYKLQILEEIDQMTEPGGVGAILRREGLYSQIISKWRHQRALGRLEVERPQRRGPKPKLEAREVEQLKRENERLRKQLQRAELVIEVQKKVSQILGLDESQESEQR